MSKKSNNNLPLAESPAGEFLLYVTADGQARVDVRLSGETIWLTQKQMSELFQKDIRTINEHVRNIFQEGELQSDAVIRNFRITANDGKTYEVGHYNLDLIISVGYRVKSHRGTQFRIWATERLREYIVKGFAMDDERLKNPAMMNYFDELLERIREVRASEKLFYQKVKDIYVNSVDYDKHSQQAQIFFKIVQNKMLYAVTGMTAAELVSKRSNSDLPNMGLTSLDGGKTGRGIRKSDVITAKNYLTEPEIKELNRIVTMFLDSAEDTAIRRQSMAMKDWEIQLGRFLQFNERPVLNHTGKVSHDRAEELAHERYAVFDRQRREEEAQCAEQEAAEEFKQLEQAVVKHKVNKTKDKI